MTENVRKIFDMLGVEPNEEFKVDGYDYRYYIDSNLDICAIVPSRDIMINLCGIFIQILKNPKLIIKIPKKKHVGDLKCEEFHKCENCPFKYLSCGNKGNTLYEILGLWLNRSNDKEIYTILKARLDKEVEE